MSLRRFKFGPTMVAFAALLPLGQAQAAPTGAVHTPAPGSAERRELMDALRGPITKAYSVKPVFKVFFLKSGGGYAYLDGAALRPSGKPVSDLAPLSGAIVAFYQKRGGHWRVVKWGTGGINIDLINECKEKYPRAPRGIFPGG